VLHRKLSHNDVALQKFVAALSIRRRLAADNPAKFEEDVAETLHEMGVLKVGMSDTASARECLAEALEIRTRLAAQAPEKFQKALEGTKANLAKLNENLIESKGETK
jgi:hypothetical protein